MSNIQHMVYKKAIITHLAPYRENNYLMNAMCNFESSPWGWATGKCTIYLLHKQSWSARSPAFCVQFHTKEKCHHC